MIRCAGSVIATRYKIDKNGKTARERKSERLAVNFELRKKIGAIPYIKKGKA